MVFDFSVIIQMIAVLIPVLFALGKMNREIGEIKNETKNIKELIKEFHK